MRTNEQNGFSLIEITAVIVIMTVLITLAGGSIIYATVWKHQRLKTGCMRVRDWIVRMQSECRMNSRDMIIQYDLNDENSCLELLFSNEGSGDLPGEQDIDTVDFPHNVRIYCVSLDPYRTYYNGKIPVAIRRDGWIDPHLVHMALMKDDVPEKIYTLEIMALTGHVNIYTEEKGWEDLE